METKTSIRKQMLSLRNAMSICEAKEKSSAIMQKVLSLSPVQTAEYILCYAGYKSEVSTNDLITELLKLGKKVYLPRVSGEEMEFYRIQSLTELTEGYKGIPEPAVECPDMFTRDLWEAQKERVIMFLPGAAFGENGARIGYGKGYYDRYLSRIPCRERLALCYELQIAEHIPADIHDIPVTTIVTEEKVRHIISSEESKRICI